MLRRDFLQQGALSLVSALAGCASGLADGSAGGEGAAIVDAHCHVFNASDVPTARFLRQVVFEDHPRQSYRTFGIRDPDVGDIFFELLVRLLGAGKAPSAREEIAYLSGRAGPVGRAQSVEAARASTIDDTARFLLEVDRRGRGLATMGVRPGERSGPSREGKFLDFMTGGGRSNMLADQPMTMAEARFASRSAFTVETAVGRYLGWFGLFRLYRHVLVERLVADTRRQGFKPLLLSPALVDYDEWLFEDVRSPLDEQAAVMGLISKRSIEARDQPVVHGYIGFDPLREVAYRAGKSTASSLATARRALTEYGFAGVKLYPPMGFRPSGNAAPYPERTQKRLGFDPSGELDLALMDLYRLCVDLDAPILAHGYASNAAGPEYELRGDPAYWIPVFEAFPALRVCIAHFGRFDVHSAGMKGRPLPEGSWEWRLGQFIKERPRQNVYADISFFSEVLSAGKEGREALAATFKVWSETFDPELDHILFGSDWIMLGKEAGYEHYVGSMHAFLRDDCGFSDDLCDKVFRRNAMRFLPLGRWSTGRSRLLGFYRKNGLDEARLPSPNAGVLADLLGR